MTKKQRTLGYSPEGTFMGGIEPFDKIFTHKISIMEPKALEKIDCLLLFGGTDIHPSYYQQPFSKHNHAPLEPSRRDKMEWSAMLYCQKHDIPMIGLCRGAQFMCALAGGTLVQHVDHHAGSDHQIETINGETLWTNSLHHQMMNPYNINHKMLAWASPPRSQRYINGEDEQIEEMETRQEPEIVYFPTIRALAIQGHPEYPSAPFPFRELCVKWASEYLFDEVAEEVK